MNNIINKTKQLYKTYESVILYIVFGVITTAVDFVFYFITTYLLEKYTSLDKTAIILISTNIAWIMAVITAFITNKFVVFKSKSIEIGTLIKEFIPFITARILSNFINAFILIIGVEMLGIQDFYVKIFSSVIVLVLNYLASKFFIFKK